MAGSLNLVNTCKASSTLSHVWYKTTFQWEKGILILLFITNKFVDELINLFIMLMAVFFYLSLQ